MPTEHSRRSGEQQGGRGTSQKPGGPARIHQDCSRERNELALPDSRADDAGSYQVVEFETGVGPVQTFR